MEIRKRFDWFNEQEALLAGNSFQTKRFGMLGRAIWREALRSLKVVLNEVLRSEELDFPVAKKGSASF